MSQLIEKLLCINRFNLPEVVQNEICNYAFQNSIEKVKQLKNAVHCEIANSNKTLSDENEKWKFYVFVPVIKSNIILLSAENCAVCGGYIETNENDVAHNIRCTCGRYRVPLVQEYDSDNSDDSYEDERNYNDDDDEFW